MPFFQQASNLAESVDWVFFFIFSLSAAFLIGITTLMLYFVVKYRKTKHPKGKDIHSHGVLEFVWTATPTVLFLVMFYFGWTNYNLMLSVPRDAMVITTEARQWAWSFTYPNGKKTTELYLALDKPVKLELRSLDVIHGFFVPAFRIKEDVVPGRQNYTWFAPSRLGSFDIQCTVICGVNHAKMLSKAIVVPVSEFEDWYFGDEDAPLPGHPRSAASGAQGSKDPVQAILDENACLTCHSLDGEILLGPSFKGLYGTKETVIEKDGQSREVVIDDAYITRAIRDPEAEALDGFPPVMPPFNMSDEDLARIIAFIKSQK
jgi:cytochrome c oxidase subunit 2